MSSSLIAAGASPIKSFPSPVFGKAMTSRMLLAWHRIAIWKTYKMTFSTALLPEECSLKVRLLKVDVLGKVDYHAQFIVLYFFIMVMALLLQKKKVIKYRLDFTNKTKLLCVNKLYWPKCNSQFNRSFT